MKVRAASWLLCLLLAGCAAGGRLQEPAVFDLGTSDVAWRPTTLRLNGVTVRSANWLATPAMAYRLLYALPEQRGLYAESRWAAPPAELLERAFNRQPATGASGCGLRLDVDELIQTFDGPQASRTLLELRAALVAPDGDAVIARKAFAAATSAPSPDARGGAAAAQEAVLAVGAQIRTWLEAMAQTDAAIARRCGDR